MNTAWITRVIANDLSWKDPVDAVLLGWSLVLVYPSPTTQPLGRIAPFKDDIGRWSSPRGADIILAAWAQVQQRTANNQQLTLYIYMCIYCLIAEIPILAYRNFHSTKFFSMACYQAFFNIPACSCVSIHSFVSTTIPTKTCLKLTARFSRSNVAW